MKISLRAKISITSIIIATVSGGTLTYMQYMSSIHTIKSSITNSQSITANQTMDKIDRFLYERTVDMQSLAGRQQLQDFLVQPSRERSQATVSVLNQQLDDFKSASGTWSELTVIDTNGNIPLLTADSQNLKHLVDTLSEEPSVVKLYNQALAGQAGYSDALPLEKGSEPAMLFMAPIRNLRTTDHPIVGVMVGELAWQTNLDILRTLRSTEANLINSKGLSLGDNVAGAEEEVLSQNLSGSTIFKQAQKNSSGSGIFPGLEDPKTTYLTAYVKEGGYLDYRGNGWTLVLATPETTAFAPIRNLAKELVIILVVALIVAIVIIMLTIHMQIIKPITLLKTATENISEDTISTPVKITSHDEIGQLGQAFNAMTDTLQKALTGLRQRTEEAESGERLMQTLLQSLPVGVMVVKAPDGEPILLNKTGEEILGRGIASHIDTANYVEAYNIMKEDMTPYPTEELPLTTTLKTKKKAVKDDMVIQRPDGTTAALRIIATPIKETNGQTERAVSVLEDITGQRELERSREEFFSIASHELRTPLTAIRGNSYMIEQMYGEKLKDPILKEMVADIHESALRLIEIVNDFLDTSRLEQKRMKFEIEPVDLVANAESVIKEYQVTGSRQKTHLEVVTPAAPVPKVLADNNRVKQVLINLVGNALKFTDNGSVTITFDVSADFVKVIVTDTGRGMTPDAQKLLFKKFEQTGSTVLTRDSVRGTGLGLYISKMIVEQMNGHIALESSELGVGTSFSFSLPITPDTAPIIPVKNA